MKKYKKGGSKITMAPKNAKEAIQQSKDLIKTYSVPSKPKTESKKLDTKKPVQKTTPVKVKTESKKFIPASDPKYTKMTPAERNANTLKNIKESFAGPQKKTKTKKPITKKTEVKKTEVKKTTPKVDNTSIEQKAKDVMSGKYGTGAARKAALGADYDKVQAIINKQSATSKPKTAPAKTETQAGPDKAEIRRPGPIEYTGPKELQLSTAEQRMNANIDKLKKEKMRKGGMVKSKRK